MKSIWKKSISLLLIFLLIFSITMLTACKTSGDSSSANNGQQNPPTTPVDPEPIEPSTPPVNPEPEQKPKPPTTPVDPDPIEPPKPTEPSTPTIPDKPTPADSYTPHLPKEMPAIRVTTADGKNDFAKETKNIYDENGNYVKPDFAYNNVQITIDNCDENYKKQNVEAQMKVRGNTTTVYDKKPFRIKFNEKQSMLGLNNNAAEKDWILLANYKDASLLRNSVGFYLGKLMYGSTGLYASDFINVKLYLNGEYWGVYLLCEQNEVSENRVNITQVSQNHTKTDIGYLIEFDCYATSEKELERFTLNYDNGKSIKLDENRNFTTNSSNKFYAIKSKVYSEEQRSFIEKYLENVYRICYRAIEQNTYWEFDDDKTDIVEVPGKDPRIAVENVVDIESAAVMYIMQEIACDFDLRNSSFYMTVDVGPSGDGKLRFQVPWDFDTAMGFQAYLTQIDEVYAADSWGNPWTVLFYKSDLIKAKMKEKWQAMKDDKIEEKIAGYIDYCIEIYKDDYAENFAKWKNIGENLKIEADKDNDPNQTSNEGMSDMYWAFPELADAAQTQGDYATYLKLWLQHRLLFIDSQFLSK